MEREIQLRQLAGKNKTLAEPVAEEILFIEKRMEELKKLPFIRVNPKNPQQQKATPAAKLYKELLQQYNSTIKTFAKLTGDNPEDEESPLRQWLRRRNVDKKEDDMDA